MLAISGGSGFIGGIIAGFLAGYLTQGIKYITRKLPQAVEGLKPTLIYRWWYFNGNCVLIRANSFDPKSSEHNAFAEQLWNIGKNSAFALIIPVLAGFISRSISDKPGFAAGLVGGMLAFLADQDLLVVLLLVS